MSGADEAALCALDDERIRATLAADIKALSSVYADDLVYVHASGVEDSRASLLANLQAGKTQYLGLRREEQRVRVFGDAAVMHGAFTAEVIMNGVERRFPASFTSVWVRTEGSWRMKAWQATSVKRG